MESKDKKSHATLEYLQKLGLEKLTAKLYIALSEKGPMSVLDASRAIGVERTRVYRLAEVLIQKGLVEEVADYKKQILQATNINNLEILVKDHEENSQFLKESFPSISSTLQSLGNKSPFTKVLYYRGIEGIKQMLWNQLNAKEEVRCFTYRTLSEAVGFKFFRNWVYEFEQVKKLRLREIRTEVFYESLKEEKTKTIMESNKVKYISSEIFPILYETDIYNDVFAMFDWKDGEIFGVEIYNQKIADTYKHIFEVFWNMAQFDKKALELREKYPIYKGQ